MALLEKRKSSSRLDDTIPLTCHIEGRDKNDSYVVSFILILLRFF
jgi:hypothetical protein